MKNILPFCCTCYFLFYLYTHQRKLKLAKVMKRTKYEFLRNEIDEKGRRIGRTEHPTLEASTSGVGDQITFEESVGVAHTHIMEFRDDEHYNDFYFLNK